MVEPTMNYAPISTLPTDPVVIAVGAPAVMAAYSQANTKLEAGDWTDKEAHCYVSCKMAWWWGGVTAYLVGVLKELLDERPGGTGFDPADILANRKGIKCGGSWTKSCVDCCGLKGK